MLLAIDVGNSKTLIGIFKGKKIISRMRFSTAAIGKTNFSSFLKKKLQEKNIKSEGIKGIIIASVVPLTTAPLSKALKSICQVRPLQAGPNLKLGLRLGYRNPHHLGQDRLANAVAAFHLYGGPIIIVDYGTATTICFISRSGYYKGGIILPGLEMMAWALARKTALLPYLRTLNRPKRLIGQDTKESIVSGLVYGLTEMVDGLIKKIKKKVKGRVKVMATGGVASFLFPYSKEIEKVDADLTLKGLRLIYEMNKPIFKT